MGQILLTDVRKKFLDYFKKNNHKIVDSSNLVPNKSKLGNCSNWISISEMNTENVGHFRFPILPG